MHRRGGSGLERLQGCAGDVRVLQVMFGIASGAYFGVSEGHSVALMVVGMVVVVVVKVLGMVGVVVGVVVGMVVVVVVVVVVGMVGMVVEVRVGMVGMVVGVVVLLLFVVVPEERVLRCRVRGSSSFPDSAARVLI